MSTVVMAQADETATLQPQRGGEGPDERRSRLTAWARSRRQAGGCSLIGGRRGMAAGHSTKGGVAGRQAPAISPQAHFWLLPLPTPGTSAPRCPSHQSLPPGTDGRRRGNASRTPLITTCPTRARRHRIRRAQRGDEKKPMQTSARLRRRRAPRCPSTCKTPGAVVSTPVCSPTARCRCSQTATARSTPCASAIAACCAPPRR